MRLLLHLERYFMKLKFTIASLIFVSTFCFGQKKNVPNSDSIHHEIDSILITDSKDAQDNIADVTLDETDLNGNGNQAASSNSLLNTRDPFFSATTYNFGAARFRYRGYTNDFSSTYMNGLTMQTLETGVATWGQWGGLNYMLRSRTAAFGLTPTPFGYGNIGSTINMDTRASKQWKQTQVGYSFSNRNYAHRVSFSHATGMGRKGWAFAFAGTFRGADEGYAPGTYANGYSYFVGVDKKIGQKHLLSFVGFAAPTELGRAGASIKEMQELSNDKYYNPNWGFQNGKKRNSSVSKTNQPVFILTHDFKIDKNSSLVTAAGYTFGDRSVSGLDWFNNSADPRPDYYRYLPSYHQDDPALQQKMQEAMMANENLRQINWDALYTANRSNRETVQNVNGISGNNVQGLRSSYIISSNVTNTKRANVRTVFNSKIGKNIDFSFGLSHQIEKNNYFRRVDDLLGGEFMVDRNQFAERDFPTNPNAAQNDINNPNRIVKVGDKYNYDYDIVINRSTAWSQGLIKLKKFDLFVAAEISNTQFWRDGHTKNGLFPDNSFGKSNEYSFNNYSVKGGVTYKISSRSNFFVSGTQMTRAPFYRNVYISPRTRDYVQNNLRNERIQSIEGGYLLTTPFFKFRLSGYYTRIKNQMSLTTFYHDVYRSFVNFGLNNNSRTDFGGELGFQSLIVKNLTLSGAASVGRYYFDGRPNVIVTQDNSSAQIATSTIYSNNYRVARVPQEAYSLGLQYRSPKYWYAGLTGNYFDQMWMDINPIRRTVDVVQGIPYKSDLWNQVVDQQRLPGQTTFDLFAGKSWKLPSSLGFKRRTLLLLNISVNNLLDNQNLISGAYEQLRYDNVENNINKFPPRLFYAFGRNYSVTATIRF